MIEQVLKRSNLGKALKAVVQNAGSAGIDRMTVASLVYYARTHRDQIATQVVTGRYLPQPILGVEIPKGNGKYRVLGIPTVTDRWLQQAVAQVLEPKFEPMFKEHSYGFRPGRSAHQAVQQSLEHIHSGNTHIVDIDLKDFFDQVDHCILLRLLYRKVKCRTTLQLIRRWLRSPIHRNGRLHKRRRGMPQGSPLSPLLSNILLHELDKELERKGHRYVRYADDFSVYAQSDRQARAIGNAVYLFLQRRLRLPINREKSGIRKPVHFQILGHGFVPTYEKGRRGRYQLVVSEKKWASLQRTLKAVTKKSLPYSFSERIARLKKVCEGWLNYFRMANIQSKLKDLDGWLRNRLRSCIWHDWKRPNRRRASLVRLGVPLGQAHAWSRTRLGRWAVAQSPILITTITLERLMRRGYVPMLTYYQHISAFNEPLYTRPVRTVV